MSLVAISMRPGWTVEAPTSNPVREGGVKGFVDSAADRQGEDLEMICEERSDVDTVLCQMSSPWLRPKSPRCLSGFRDLSPLRHDNCFAAFNLARSPSRR